MATQNEQHYQPTKQTVVIHRFPFFKSKLIHHFRSQFNFVDPLTDSLSPETLNSVRALLCVGRPCPLTSETLARYPSLEIVVALTAGVDHIDLTECSRRGISVTNAGPIYSEDVADYAIALLLDVLRRVSAADRFVWAGSWPLQGDYPLGFKLGGRRVGIIGLGSIGSEIAKRLVAFGCTIAYISRKKKPSVPYTYYGNAHDLAANTDVLMVCCALTEETHHIVNKDVMTALGKTGVIINVGRGALVDEEQLVEFLVRGELGSAGIDVFENEPDVPRSLFELDNVVLSPHVSAATAESMQALQDLVSANLKAFFSNQPLLSPVHYH